MLTENQFQLKVVSDKLMDDCSFSSEGNDDIASEEEDQNAHVDASLFEQQNFLFLFDHYLNFSKRDNFQTDTDITPQDYMEMKKVNRMILLRFLDKAVKLPGLKGFEVKAQSNDQPDECKGFDIEQKQSDQSMSSPEKSGTDGSDGSPSRRHQKVVGRFPFKQRDSFEKLAADIKDEEIDNNFKILLQKKEHGQYLDADTVAHLEYFMNTLNFDYKCQTENPFNNPNDFPALMFKPNDMSGATSDITMDSVVEESSSNSSDSCIDEEDMKVRNPTDLIDVDVLGIDPLQINEEINQTTTPKQKSSDRFKEKYPLGQYEKNASIKSAVSPIKQLVKNEIKRQSVVLVKGMSIIERHSILINPQNQLEMIKKKVKYDRKSLLSSKNLASPQQNSLNSVKKNTSFIDDVNIQEKIIKQSINQILPKNGSAWYPNYKIHQRYSAIFTGSPEPKKQSHMSMSKPLAAHVQGNSMFMAGDFGAQRGADSLIFKLDPISTAPGFCEGIIDDEEMVDQQILVSDTTGKQQSMFSGDSIGALQESLNPQKFKIPSQFDGASQDNQSGFRNPYKEDSKLNPSKLENEDVNSELSV